MSLGHPSSEGMLWHRRHTPGADFTDEDANTPRGLCSGCVSGGMRQASTDHLREHRPPPTYPGQQFALDAFTTSDTSRHGHKHADILTCLYSRIRYPVFTKNRSASELCQQMTVTFDLHPQWSRPANSGPRFIRVDAERNYSSTEFLHLAAERGYTLERTPLATNMPMG